MGILDIFKKKKDPSNKKYRLEMAQRIAGQAIKYVTERRDNVEEVIGKGGCMSLHDGDFIVFSSSETVFRCKAEELEAWELLSKDGVVITGPDYEHGGVRRTIIVHYVYYRK
jgi:hypothetical protein